MISVFATNASGSVVWTAKYDPFGNVHAATGTPAAIRFPGQWFQSESGLHQNWMRDYDPTTGRYLQADPLGLIDGASVYGYAGQSPLVNIDLTGECFGPAIALLPACVGAAFVVWGWLNSDPCLSYTWEQAGWDFFNGSMWGWGGGAAWKGGGAVWKAWKSWRAAPYTEVAFAPGLTSNSAMQIVTNSTAREAMNVLAANGYKLSTGSKGVVVAEKGGKRYAFYTSTGGGNPLAAAGVSSANVTTTTGVRVKIRFK